jgi:hypothetical protein
MMGYGYGTQQSVPLVGRDVSVEYPNDPVCSDRLRVWVVTLSQ